ncbi:MAG: WxcM-like domain-containing protein [Actinomycetota bacterium]
MVGNMNPPADRDKSIAVVNATDAQLLAVEFELLPFAVQRIFVVSSHSVSVNRGNHLAGCNQLLILLSGKVSLKLVRPDMKVTNFYLDAVGSSAFIGPEDFVTYELLNPDSEILVLADKSYADSFANRERKK